MGLNKGQRKRPRRKSRYKKQTSLLTEDCVAEASAMTVIRHSPAPTTEKLHSTLRYQSAPTVLGLPEGSGIKNENGNEILTSNIIVGHYFNNPLVTGYVREKHPPRRLLEGYEKLAKRQNRKRSKAMRRLKEEGTWVVGPVSDGSVPDLSEASAGTRTPSATIAGASPPQVQPSLGSATQPAVSAIVSTSFITPTITPSVQPICEVNISDRADRGIIGYNVGQTLQEVQRMFPPRFQELIEEIVEGHTRARYGNRKYWYIYFKSEAALQRVLGSAPPRWIAREGRRESDPKITVMKDRRSNSGSDSDSSLEAVCLARQSGQMSPRARQVMYERSAALQEERDRVAQAQSTIATADITSLEEVSAVAQPSAKAGDILSDFSLMSIEKESIGSQPRETQQALPRNINPDLSGVGGTQTSSVSTARSTVEPPEQPLPSVSMESSQMSKITRQASQPATVEPISQLEAPIRPSAAPSVSSASYLRLRRTAATEITPIFSHDNSFVNATPLINTWGSRTQNRPVASTQTAAIIPTPLTPTRPYLVRAQAPAGSSSRLGEAMTRSWPQLSFNVTKEKLEIQKAVSEPKANEPSESTIEESDTAAPVSGVTQAVTSVAKSTVVGTGNPESAPTKPATLELISVDPVTTKPVTPEPILLEPANPKPSPVTSEPTIQMTDDTILPQPLTVATKAMIETQAPKTTLGVPIIVYTTATPPDLLDLDEDFFPISSYGESIFELPPLTDSPSGSASTAGDWRKDLEGLEWEVAGKEMGNEEKNRIQDSGVEAVVRVMEAFKIGGEKREDVDTRPVVQGNNVMTEEVSEKPDSAKKSAAFTTPITTDTYTKVRKEFGGKTAKERTCPLSNEEVTIGQKPHTEIIGISNILVYKSARPTTADGPMKTEDIAIPGPADDEEWEDEDQTREVVKNKTRGQHALKRTKWKDFGQDMVSAHIKSLRRAGMKRS